MAPLFLLAICGALLLPNAAHATSLKLSGTLKHGAGFHVVVIKPNGLSVDTEVAKNGRFKLTVPARGARDAVVQLLRANGYHGEATIGVTANDGTRGDNAAQRIWVQLP